MRQIRFYEWASVVDCPEVALFLAMVHLALSDLNGPYPELRRSAREFLCSDFVRDACDSLGFPSFLKFAMRKSLRPVSLSRGSIPLELRR